MLVEMNTEIYINNKINKLDKKKNAKLSFE